MTQKLIVDFLQITSRGHYSDQLRSAIEAAPETFVSGARNMEYHGQRFLVARPVTSPTHLVSGVLYRRRASALPRRVAETEAAHLGLEPDEDLAEPLFYAIDSRTGVSATARTRDGAPRGRLAQVVREFGFPSPVNLACFENPDVQERVSRAQSIRKLTFRLKGVPSSILELAAGSASDASARLLEDFDARSVTITISVGNNPGSLNLDRAREVIGRFYGCEEVTQLKATLRDDDDSASEALDLILDRATTTIEPDENERSIDTDDCLRRLRMALSEFCTRWE